MNIIQDSEEMYGDVRFTLTEEDKKKVGEGIKKCVYNSLHDKDTVLKEDASILIDLLMRESAFTSETLTYCKTTLVRIQYWLQQ
jgi:hypothetical protein